jgi:hypothetical protein
MATVAPHRVGTVPVAVRSRRDIMNTTARRVCIYCGPVMVVGWLVGFGISHFIVPPHPGASAHTIQSLFVHHTFRIRLGLTMTMFACALLVPFSAAIAAEMRRIEGRHQVLAATQVTSGAVVSLEFILPQMIWLSVAFRPSAVSPATLRMFDDMAWIMFVALISSAMVQSASIAFAAFIDRSPEPIFPRWFGYLNAWVTLFIAPCGIVQFFHHGAFAWRGLMGFYVPVAVYTIWIFACFFVLHRQLDRQPDEEEPLDPRVEARLTAVEADLRAVRSPATN